MIDFLFFGRAKEERKHLHAMAHFLAKRVHYGRDFLPEKLVERLNQARELCAEGLRITTPGQRRSDLLAQLEKEYGDLLRTDRHHGRKENAEVALVAIVLALGVRAYFLQPFKIPTHSMRPTLLGILNQPEDKNPPSWPMRIFELAKEGKSYHKAVAPREGQIVSVREGRLFGFIPWTTTEILADGWKEFVVCGLQEAREGGLKVRSGDQVKKDGDIEDPSYEDLNKIGTVAYIIKILQLPDGNTTAIIQGKKRFELGTLLQSEPYFKAEVHGIDQKVFISKKNDKNFEALIASIKDLSIQIINQSPNLPSEAAFAIRNIESPVFLVNFVASNLNVEITEKQNLLSILDLEERANRVLGLLTKELQMLDLKNQIQNKVKVDMDKQQRDYLLNQQLKQIQEELGNNPNEQQINEIKAKAYSRKWPEAAFKVFEKEIAKLQRMNPMAMEFGMQVNYLEVMVDLPWDTFTEDNFDLHHAQKVLDKDHYGMEKIKERIIEYLAVLKLKGDMKSPILCLVGPPGVGKTSLGKSIARAIGRNYIRMSLGGLHDEAEIRGHRRTYIGAMPGRIVQSIRKAKSSNPVFVLDEIDKVSGMTVNGDP